MPPAQRCEFWREQFSRCIRCYACRQVCRPASASAVSWRRANRPGLSPLPKWQDNLIFQVTRMLHGAGRLSDDCGACERACPVNIPLRGLSKKMEEIVAELFDYKAGTDKDAPP